MDICAEFYMKIAECVKVFVLVLCCNFFITSVMMQATLGWAHAQCMPMYKLYEVHMKI